MFVATSENQSREYNKMASIIHRIKELIAGPFRKSNGVNRNIIIDYLKCLKGVFLEIGPGCAPLLEAVQHIDNDKKIIIDLPEMVGYCESLGYKCLAQDASIEKWRLDDESVDVVISNQCLEHIPNTDDFILECRRVLKEGGILVLSVPNQGALAFIFLMLLTINPPMNFVSDKFYSLGNPLSNMRMKKRNVPGHSHLRLFTTRAMNDLLKAYGFTILKNHGGSWGTWGGKYLASIFPYYGLYTTVMAKKINR